jgi:hypothetical protein
MSYGKNVSLNLSFEDLQKILVDSFQIKKYENPCNGMTRFQKKILRVNNQSHGFYYGSFICEMWLYINENPVGEFSVKLFFNSGDDSDFSGRSKTMSLEKANRFYDFVEKIFVELEEVPTLVEIKEIEAKSGLYFNL